MIINNAINPPHPQLSALIHKYRATYSYYYKEFPLHLCNSHSKSCSCCL